MQFEKVFRLTLDTFTKLERLQSVRNALEEVYDDAYGQDYHGPEPVQW